MPPIKTGILLWNQASDWPSYLAAAQRTDELGYDTFWAWDHLYAIFGDPLQDIFEGWASLSALAVATQRLKLGLLVGANTFRNPGVVAKLATTLDHMSGGRAMLGLGGAWMEPEHTAMGIDFGAGFGQRLDWLEESVTAVEAMLAGDAFTSDPGGRYQFNAAEAHPLPLQKRLPRRRPFAPSPSTRTCGMPWARPMRWPTRSTSCAATARPWAATSARSSSRSA
jgi:alkanesulfonate monooxygenase SsuD/methylene tetrahydromethanopterin reductase-like flavin-dependent oxidoreductase (luciferase family)